MLLETEEKLPQICKNHAIITAILNSLNEFFIVILCQQHKMISLLIEHISFTSHDSFSKFE